MWSKSEKKYIFGCHSSNGNIFLLEEIYECYTNESILPIKQIDNFLFRVTKSNQNNLVSIQFVNQEVAYLFGKMFEKLIPKFKQNFKDYPNINNYDCCTNNDELEYYTVEIDISQQHIADLNKLCDFLREHGLSADVLEKIKIHARSLNEVESNFYDQLPAMQQDGADKKELFTTLLTIANSISSSNYKIRALLELADLCKRNSSELENELQMVLTSIKAAEDNYGYSNRAAMELRQFALNKKLHKRTRDDFEACAVTASTTIGDSDEKIREDVRLDIQLALCASDTVVDRLRKMRSTIIKYLKLGPYKANNFFSEINLSTIIVQENEDKIDNLFIKLIIELLVYTKYLYAHIHNLEQKIDSFNVANNNMMIYDYSKQELEIDMKLQMQMLREESISLMAFLTHMRSLVIKFLNLNDEQINKFFSDILLISNTNANTDEGYDGISDFIVNILMYSRHIEMYKSDLEQKLEYLEQQKMMDHTDSISESSSTAKKQKALRF